jgi:hypothetical protein
MQRHGVVAITSVQLVIDKSHTLNTLFTALEDVLNRKVFYTTSLQPKEAADNLKIVFHPVVHLLEERLIYSWFAAHICMLA